MLPDIRWSMSDSRIYLTFDDGPDKEITPRLLSLLDKFEIQTTFFLLGHKVEQYPEIVLRIKEGGHTIGNHSYSHPRLLKRSEQDVFDELNRTDEAIRKIITWKPTLFRPPHGVFGITLLRVLRKTGHKMVLWNASVKDYEQHATAIGIKKKLLKVATPGKIVLLHDGHRNSSNTLIALETTLGLLKDREVDFSALPDTR